MSFSDATKILFNELKDRIFSELKNEEGLTLNLSGESSLFVRLNNSLVRQNTHVEQRELTLNWQNQNDKQVSMSMSLCGDLEFDTQTALSLLQRARAESTVLPSDPAVVTIKNQGQSNTSRVEHEFSLDDVLKEVRDQAANSDLTGLLTAGPQVRANANNLGQTHWFSTRSFYIDYSLFTLNISGENKAVKNIYAAESWNGETFRQGLQSAKNKLALLKKANHQVAPGKYRVYLEPAATSELAGMLSWGALSYAQYKKGNSPFAQLAEGKIKLSSLFSVRENFDIGLATPFNSLGEVAPPNLSLIDQGELKTFLISTGSAKEFNAVTNYASSNESPRSLEIQSGQLDESSALKSLGTGLWLGNLHYCNWSDMHTARVTGMTRYACFWVENGEIVAPIQDLRFDVSLYDIWGANLEAVGKQGYIDPSTDTYFQRSLGGKKIPSQLIRDFQFTL